MRKLADMTPDEVGTYMQMLAELTRTVVPPDADFLVIVGAGGMIHFVRGLADDVEAGRAARGVG
jgi:predicted deacylase